METYDKGRLGEDLAARYLADRGCRVLQRNYRREGCELDLVAMEGETLVFAEVKARSSRAWGYGREAGDAAKQRRIIRAAQAYLQETDYAGPCRLDVVEVDLNTRSIVWIRDAFSVAE